MKTKYPIKLKTIKAGKAELCCRIRSDVERVNAFYRIFPEGLASGLIEDLEYLLTCDIAREFRLVLYNPLNPEVVFAERIYERTFDPVESQDIEEFQKIEIPSPYECDICVVFADEFQQLDSIIQRQSLKKCNLNWQDLSQFGMPWESPDPVAPRKSIGSSAATVERKDQKISPLGAINVRPAPEINEADIQSGSSSVKSPFSSTKTLFIAEYSDSRRLIENFVRVVKPLGLAAIQWTYSEGFEVIDERCREHAVVGEDYFVHRRLSPLETLRVIKNEARRNTVYLLEDFHYYLKRESLGGGDYGELISMIKSLPDALRLSGNRVVILAPTIDLPPEIAPIVEVIKDDAREKGFHHLNIYGTDLTQLVLKKALKPVIGRDKEILECLKVLSRFEGNNPLLVGKSGVGKTAIVEGLAAAIVKNDIPRVFANKRIISLNLNSMVSGTKYRGEFERRLEGVLDEVRSNSDRVIVFIDELHSLLGMGSAEGATGAENILKPSLARGEFPCIGATTAEEYARYIAPDRALARRFQVVNVSEPGVPETIRILKGVKSIYEHHHNVVIPDETLVTCVEISNRVLVNECFPGKALRMLDTVCSAAALSGKEKVTAELVVSELEKSNASV